MATAKKVTKPAAKKPAAKKPAVKTPAVKKPASKVDQKALDAALASQPPIVSRAMKTAPVKVQPKPANKTETKADKGPNKMQMARELFKKMKGKERKDVVQAFQSEIGLTKAGSNTYYQILKSE